MGLVFMSYLLRFGEVLKKVNGERKSRKTIYGLRSWRNCHEITTSVQIISYSILSSRLVSCKSPHYENSGGGVAQWLGCRISDQGVPGSNPGRCTFRCCLEQVTFTFHSTG